MQNCSQKLKRSVGMLTVDKREQFSATRSAIYIYLYHIYACMLYMYTHIVLKKVIYVHTHIDI